VDRYRVIGLLGRGGMGEVYRADDLKLGQPVALKFLPRVLGSDPVRRERFFAEVRITRQLAHPNICRVYDIAEVDGQHFLSMEYIDGEDLASLIKRIGYLSNEKALDVARQLAAGLAAAHEKGVLHRDLKPSNIMIDGHGRVRITDFGLAVAADEETDEREVLGTPAYMAPEQFAGKGATTRSDIYSFGLVLYEIFGGKRAFTGTTIADLRQQKDNQTPRALSDIRQGIDPVVERVIARCLERDPNARPASVAQIALGLPGGDPLAAAIAAGETPPPELVAASGLKEGLRPLIALAILIWLVAGSVAIIRLRERLVTREGIQFEKSPDVLTERSREILSKAGWTESLTYSATIFAPDDDYVRYIEESDRSNTHPKTFGPRAVRFQYRQSTSPLSQPSLSTPETSKDDSSPGAAAIMLDMGAHLLSLRVNPPREESATGAAPAPDWNALFSEAGLDLSQWKPVEPRLNPASYADTRAAWQGFLADWPGVPVRIEAAAYRGKPVSFEVVGPWNGAAAGEAARRLYIFLGFALVFIPALLSALLFARRNYRLGRGDRRGAKRLAVALACGATVFLVLTGEIINPDALGIILLTAAVGWVFYIGMEPSVRRWWPHILVSWTRLLSGEWRDPLVGRDILAGCGFGLACAFIRWIFTPELVQGEIVLAGIRNVMGTGPFVTELISIMGQAILMAALLNACVLTLLRFLLRNGKAAVAAFCLISTLTYAFNPGHPFGNLGVGTILAVGLIVVCLMRFGLLGLVGLAFVDQVFRLYPMTWQPSAWYSTATYASLISVAAVVAYSFKISLGSRRILDTFGSED
jgi:serine/threonine-protein kinase